MPEELEKEKQIDLAWRTIEADAEHHEQRGGVGMKTIEMIPIGRLKHHPENPRKDLGDLTELTASIKANGILQNLTVVHAIRKMDETEREQMEELYSQVQTEELRQRLETGEYEDPSTYWVVIGNRRFEAAQLAGLTEVPCVISDMDRRQQIATMLEENMQRSDLTAYEQAQGFQMMMDLGFTEKEISEKTGLSEKTVKDRIKLTKFDKKYFEGAVQRGATLMDLLEVSKIEDKSEQALVLAKAGTNNFRQVLLNRLGEQKFRKGSERLEAIAKEYGMEKIQDSANVWNDYAQYYDYTTKNTDKETEIRKKLKKAAKEYSDRQLFFRFRKNWENNEAIMEIYERKQKTERKLSEEEKTERQRTLARNKHVKEVKQYWNEAYNLRRHFIRNYGVKVNGTGISTIGKLIAKYALSEKPSWGTTYNKQWDKTTMVDLIGLVKEEYEDDKATIWEMMERRSDIPMIRAVVGWICSGGIFWPDDPEHGLYESYDGSYSRNSNQASGIKELYEFLKEIGYVMSDMEIQLMDGTHPVFKRED